jgi:hypothetical protein
VELAPYGVAYTHLAELGGHRDPVPGSHAGGALEPHALTAFAVVEDGLPRAPQLGLGF